MEKLVCPNCKSQNQYEFVNSVSRQNLQCPSCKTNFQTWIVNIRAKRSRGYRSNNKRQFSVRVIDFSGQEHLIEFINAGYGDFELRSKDQAAISYVNGQLKMIQNLTIHQYMEVSNPSCYLATYVYGPNSKEVAQFRNFRDRVLINSRFLSKVVRLYYQMSPKLIEKFGDDVTFRICVRMLLKPIFWAVLIWSLAN